MERGSISYLASEDALRSEQRPGGVEGVGVTRFSEKDVVRHPLVARIVAAYNRGGQGVSKKP